MLGSRFLKSAPYHNYFLSYGWYDSICFTSPCWEFFSFKFKWLTSGSWIICKGVDKYLGICPFHPFALSHNYWGPRWIETHCRDASCYQAETRGSCTALLCIYCCNTKELVQLFSFFWRRWKLEGLIIFCSRFGFRKMRHDSCMARGMDFQLVTFSRRVRTHRTCSRQWEITGILGIKSNRPHLALSSGGTTVSH